MTSRGKRKRADLHPWLRPHLRFSKVQRAVRAPIIDLMGDLGVMAIRDS